MFTIKYINEEDGGIIGTAVTLDEAQHKAKVARESGDYGDDLIQIWFEGDTKTAIEET
jgi:hypothetical protein